MTNYRSAVNFTKAEEIERMLYLFFYALMIDFSTTSSHYYKNDKSRKHEYRTY